MSIDDSRLQTLTALAKKALWLSSWTIHNANHIRPNADGLKVGGHQASSASLATIMSALYFSVLKPEDRVAGFLQRLPVKYRGADLWAISSEDHYLRVHTDRGEEMILMRLADAIRELGEDNGLQTHRSWWVSRTGIRSARREGGRVLLELKSGEDVPVSRSYQPALKDAGLAP